MSYIIITTIVCYLMWDNIWSRIFNIRVKNIIHEHRCVHVSPNTYHNYILKALSFLICTTPLRTTPCWITSLQITLFDHPWIYNSNLYVDMLFIWSSSQSQNSKIPSARKFKCEVRIVQKRFGSAIDIRWMCDAIKII